MFVLCIIIFGWDKILIRLSSQPPQKESRKGCNNVCLSKPASTCILSSSLPEFLCLWAHKRYDGLLFNAPLGNNDPFQIGQVVRLNKLIAGRFFFKNFSFSDMHCSSSKIVSTPTPIIGKVSKVRICQQLLPLFFVDQ